MSFPAVQIRNLSFFYNSSKPVLHIPELVIDRGEKAFLHGPSGCGKSTLLGIVAGVLAARSGQVRILETNLHQLSGSQRDTFRSLHIGYIFQLFNLIPYLSVMENITLPCLINSQRRSRIKKLSLEEAATQMAQQLEIEAVLSQPVLELSVGQQQRVAVARALLGDPELIIADEPTSALDSDHRQTFLRLLFAQCERVNTTLLFVSHDRSLKEFFSKDLSLPELNQVTF